MAQHKWIEPLSAAFTPKYNPAPTPTKQAYTLTRDVMLTFQGSGLVAPQKGSLLRFDLPTIMTVNQGGSWLHIDLDSVVMVGF